jgi:hypothetical protein
VHWRSGHRRRTEATRQIVAEGVELIELCGTFAGPGLAAVVQLSTARRRSVRLLWRRGSLSRGVV